MAHAVLLPGFDGLTAPDWLRRRLDESLGGVCLFARNVADLDQLRTLTDDLRSGRPDLVVSIDEEAGDVTRLDAAAGSRFPGNFALGRVDDVAATEAIAADVGRLLVRAGVTLNLAPCADVALDPANPVIGTRSFGRSPDLVARHTAAFVRGQQSVGVAACVKHFPGHGDTGTDTHLGLATLDESWDELELTALPPFRAALDAGVAAVMAGHLLVPAVDALPATVSHRWLTGILRGDMGFTGAVVTDALEMAAIAAQYGIVDGAVRALAAGADLLCFGGEDAGEDLVDAVATALVEAVRQGRISDERLYEAASRARALGRPAPDAGDQAAPALADEIADRALLVNGPLPALPGAGGTLVLRCQPQRNIAVGRVPWGPARPEAGLPGPVTEHLVLPGAALPATEIAAARSVLLITRDRHRHPFMDETATALRRLRPDAVLVEMGTAAPDSAPAIASAGATLANSRAVVRALLRVRAGTGTE
ncbi:glycoside hydrolase family 3 protein [Nakamurella sp. YIM 132087]|uniref:Glycoside hydrolase family 3 protein n=1 Tax=Nakamurella alba TaxID=2665158 RepID=A0A7K1FGW3_9ACTN|nr:glycoside hydrolase family 3 protein [Nakamurella alba]